MAGFDDHLRDGQLGASGGRPRRLLIASECRAPQRGVEALAFKHGRQRAAAMLEITAYTIRHTVAAKMRKRGVPVWEDAGFLGTPADTRRPNDTQSLARTTLAVQSGPSMPTSRSWGSVWPRPDRVLVACQRPRVLLCNPLENWWSQPGSNR